MKKLLTILLIVAYGIATYGSTVYMHYCMGKLVNIEMTSAHNTTCKGCHQSKKTSEKSCCKSEFKQLKTDKEYEKGYYNYPFFSPHFLPNTNGYNEKVDIASIAIDRELVIHRNVGLPPPAIPIPIYILNCDYRI